MSRQATIPAVMLAVLLIVALIAAAAYDAATCAEWQTVPGEVHCTTWTPTGSSFGTVDCQPVRRCVRRTP